ncbi:MAG: hypothetical protein K2N87_11965 [Eubacterium sp.]|nr:hypothetical protein [Eubacterium sp.]
MQYIKIIPLVGIEVHDATIALSASRTDVENLLGEPYGVWKNSLYYFDNELRFDFDKDGKIEFIEFLGGRDGKIQPTIYGVSAFQAEADELYDILSEKNRGEIDDCENGYSYGFVNISIGVFRSSVPEEVEEMIGEAQEEGEPMDADEIAYEMGKANHWATIGIGIAGYYRKLL